MWPLSRALATGGTESPGVHEEGAWKSLPLPVAADRCLLGGTRSPLQGPSAVGQESGTGLAVAILVVTVIYKTKSDLSFLTINVQHLGNAKRMGKFELSGILSGFCQVAVTLSPDTSYLKDFPFVQHAVCSQSEPITSLNYRV